MLIHNRMARLLLMLHACKRIPGAYKAARRVPDNYPSQGSFNMLHRDKGREGKAWLSVEDVSKAPCAASC